MEMGPIEDNPDVDAVLLIGSGGATGFGAVGDVLAGDVNPSGRTTSLARRQAISFHYDRSAHFPNAGFRRVRIGEALIAGGRDVMTR